MALRQLSRSVYELAIVSRARGELGAFRGYVTNVNFDTGEVPEGYYSRKV